MGLTDQIQTPSEDMVMQDMHESVVDESQDQLSVEELPSQKDLRDSEVQMLNDLREKREKIQNLKQSLEYQKTVISTSSLTDRHKEGSN